MTNVLLLTSHSIAEYDDLRMLSDLGYDVFSIGAYTKPSEPGDDKRPALPDVPFHADFEALCWEQRARHDGDDPGFVIDWAKGDLHPAIVDWADAIIVHHFPEAWIAGQWDRIRDKRVIWRTCGQSDPRLEAAMARLDGLEIVRYSPKERNLGNYAGETTLIRFGKYPEDWGGWDGGSVAVANVTQNMVERADACNLAFWRAATEGLPTLPAGPGSEQLGGVGTLHLRRDARLPARGALLSLHRHPARQLHPRPDRSHDDRRPGRLDLVARDDVDPRRIRGA
jgi:hypothetical protein